MRYAIAAALAAGLGLSVTAYAQTTPSCTDQATTKKLAGAALKSFMTKCEKDASEACTKSASDKKLAGAAKTSFTTKCVKDSIGAK